MTAAKMRLKPLAAVVFVLLCAPLMVGALPARAAAASVSVVATGLNNPRGLHFGPDGQLYVAEGGLGGTAMNTVGQCLQVPAPVGPYTSGGNSASVSRVNTATGAVTRIATNLPSSQTSMNLGGFVSGVADVAFVRGALYVMTSGAGCSHGLAGTDNVILRVKADGSVTQVADLSAFLRAHPVANPEPSTPPGDFEPDGTWYGMAVLDGSLYALEPNSQQLDRIETNGHIARVVDFSTRFAAPADWRGPSSIVRAGGAFYVGTLMPFPITQGSAQIFKVTPGGHFESVAGGLTTVLGVATDSAGRLYALEMSNAGGFPRPGTGDVVRINRDGSRQTIASGLNLPTAMTFGPDGNLYISNQGFGFPPGAGEIVKVTIG